MRDTLAEWFRLGAITLGAISVGLGVMGYNRRLSLKAVWPLGLFCVCLGMAAILLALVEI